MGQVDLAALGERTPSPSSTLSALVMTLCGKLMRFDRIADFVACARRGCTLPLRRLGPDRGLVARL